MGLNSDYMFLEWAVGAITQNEPQGLQMDRSTASSKLEKWNTSKSLRMNIMVYKFIGPLALLSLEVNSIHDSM